MKITGLSVSPAHNYFGRHGQSAGEHPLLTVAEVECVAGRGLRGDRFFDYKPGYAGQISFFSAEVHDAMGDALGIADTSPAAHRRNVIVRGADLNALIGHEFELQGVRFQGVAECRPCYWMDQAFAPGAEVWLRGNGGLRAKILSDGWLRVDPEIPAGILLAGGRSTRMGSDKAGLKWGERTLGEHQAAVLRASGAWPWGLSCRADQPWTPIGFRRAEDAVDGAGPVAGLVNAWRGLSAPVVVALAVDVPYVPPAFLAELARTAMREKRSVVPVRNGRFEPLAAAWHGSARPFLEQAAAIQASFQNICSGLRSEDLLLERRLNPFEEKWFHNLNHPSDLMT